jgi:hypothetical protein
LLPGAALFAPRLVLALEGMAAGGVFAAGIFCFLQNVNLVEGAALLGFAVKTALRHIATDIGVLVLRLCHGVFLFSF